MGDWGWTRNLRDVLVLGDGETLERLLPQGARLPARTRRPQNVDHATRRVISATQILMGEAVDVGQSRG